MGRGLRRDPARNARRAATPTPAAPTRGRGPITGRAKAAPEPRLPCADYSYIVDDTAMNSGPFLGEFEHLVLLAVARLEGEGYGVTIRQEIERRTGRTPAIGAVYATLERLESKGYVSSRLGEPTAERGGRARRHYRLEPAGAEALARSRRVLERMWEGVELEPRPGAS